MNKSLGKVSATLLTRFQETKTHRDSFHGDLVLGWPVFNVSGLVLHRFQVEFFNESMREEIVGDFDRNLPLRL